jgi:hypothetical protein
MPPLHNPRHERFCQELFKSEPQNAAYEAAGYRYHEGNASRLRSNERVISRLSELQREAQRSNEISVASLLDELGAFDNTVKNKCRRRCCACKCHPQVVSDGVDAKLKGPIEAIKGIDKRTRRLVVNLNISCISCSSRYEQEVGATLHRQSGDEVTAADSSCGAATKKVCPATCIEHSLLVQSKACM